MKTLTQDEWLCQGTARYGSEVYRWAFVCPMCGTRQTIGDQVEAAKAAGIDPNKVVGFNCIGRATGQGDAGIAAKNRGEPWDKGCNWTLGGLFRVHQTEVIVEDGVRRPVFEFAD